jgi:hypothetical protein
VSDKAAPSAPAAVSQPARPELTRREPARPGPTGTNQSFIGAAHEPAPYQRVTAGELRRKLDVLAPPPADLAGTALRPTISGPSGGCPFLLDARLSPTFAALDLDPERIQTKGCTFCLDNFGAYVVPKQTEVVAAWIEGLRRIRAARPEAREILLTDERPHPFLPAFFEAIAGEPGLGPVDLLWKSRVDWLLEFAPDVERACELAERSGSLVHLYLVGFENFDRAHLDLFNKGHGPDLNEAAIEKMRELQARFPRSFEHRRHRSHGIVLFTPWTSPEALLENARWMRRLRFHELRTEAVKTRLRLYPRVPLHSLAARDGLLTERFEEGRGDRAAEQGYAASVPWRFRDARVETIFQLANALHDSDRSLTDADLIELATRFVLRFPGLAELPSLAHLPLRAAIETWGAPLAFLLETLGPGATGFDPEIEAIGTTPKRASLKESVRADDADDLARAYRAMGFASAVVLHHTMARPTGAHSAGNDHAIVAVAEDETALRELLEAQRALHRDRAAIPHVPGLDQSPFLRSLGELMGYPACCAAAFAALEDRGDNLHNERLPFLRHPGAPLHPLLHRTGLVRFVSHHLCSPDCAASIEQAERVLALLGDAFPEAPARLLAALRVPSLFLDYERNTCLEGAWDEAGAFRIDRVHTSGRARDFEALLAKATSVRLDPGSITLTFPEETSRGFAEDGTRASEGGVLDGAKRAASARTIVCDRPLLTTPGAPLAGPALAFSKAASAPPSAGKTLESPALPALPAALRAGVRVAAYSIAAVDRTDATCTITLARGTDRLRVHLRAHTAGAPYTLRKGRWAVDVDEPARLSDPARAAVGLLVRALPRW